MNKIRKFLTLTIITICLSLTTLTYADEKETSEKSVYSVNLSEESKPFSLIVSYKEKNKNGKITIEADGDKMTYDETIKSVVTSNYKVDFKWKSQYVQLDFAEITASSSMNINSNLLADMTTQEYEAEIKSINEESASGSNFIIIAIIVVVAILVGILYILMLKKNKSEENLNVKKISEAEEIELIRAEFESWKAEYEDDIDIRKPLSTVKSEIKEEQIVTQEDIDLDETISEIKANTLKEISDHVEENVSKKSVETDDTNAIYQNPDTANNVANENNQTANVDITQSFNAVNTAGIVSDSVKKGPVAESMPSKKKKIAANPFL